MPKRFPTGKKKPLFPQISGSPRTPNKLQAAISRGSSMISATSTTISGRTTVYSFCRCCNLPKAKEEKGSAKGSRKTAGSSREGEKTDASAKATPNPGCTCLVESPLVHAQKVPDAKKEAAVQKKEPVKPQRVSSPLHSIGKQKWIESLVDPKTTSLPIPVLPPIAEKNESPPTAVVLEKRDKKDKKEKNEKGPSKLPPCQTRTTNTDNKPGSPAKMQKPNPQFPALAIQPNAVPHRPYGNAIKYRGIRGHNVVLPPSTAPPPSSEMNTLPMVYNRQARKFMVIDPLPGSIFSQCPEPGGWFTVHPDWRREPGIRGMWSY